MSTLFGRQIGAAKNEYKHSLDALVGIAQGLVCDRRLEEKEIFFLHDWLAQNRAMADGWPGDIVLSRVKEVVADGVITEEERTYLVDTLLKLVGSDGPDLPQVAHSTCLACDDNPSAIVFKLRAFCFTGDFVYGKRSLCELAIEKRGGMASNRINKTLNYLVIGSLGSKEWKHGSFGLKVEQAMKYKRDGCPICILDEQRWSAALDSAEIKDEPKRTKIDNKTSDLREVFKNEVEMLKTLGWHVVLTEESIKLFLQSKGGTIPQEEATIGLRRNYDEVLL